MRLLLRIYLWIELFIHLQIEIIIAALQVARLSITHGKNIKPMLIKIPLRIKSDRDIYLFTSFITLTPGTISVEIEDGILLVHCIHYEADENSLARSIQNSFEDRLLRIGSLSGASS